MNRSKVMRSGYTWFRGVPGVGSYVNNEWRLVRIGQWIEYACGVKSETINLDRRVDLKCAWTSFPREEILGWIVQVSLESASHVSGYDASTQYRLDTLSIPGWLEIYCDGTVSGESRSWQQFSCAIDSELFNIVDSSNIENSSMTLVSGAPEIDKQQIIGITLGSSGAPENTDLVCRFRNHNSARTTRNDEEQWLQCRQILTREFMAPPNFTWSTNKLAHLIFITYWLTQIRLWSCLPDICLPLISSHIHRNNHLTWNGIQL